MFLYALWRDVVWDKTTGVTMYFGTFLYALWRDVVWDAPYNGRPYWKTWLFLYALWRDVVWDTARGSRARQATNK